MTPTLFEKLLQAEDEATADEILKQAGYGLDNEGAWRALGDMENNFSTVGNQQTEATAGAGREGHQRHRRCLDGRMLPRRSSIPKGLRPRPPCRDAVQQFFNVRDGLLGNLDAQRQTELANKIARRRSRREEQPCYLCRPGRGADSRRLPRHLPLAEPLEQAPNSFCAGKIQLGRYWCASVLRSAQHAAHRLASPPGSARPPRGHIT